MRLITQCTFVILMITSTITSAESTSKDSKKMELIYQPFPSGFQYLKQGEALNKAVKEANRSVVRSHGWNLWAGIMQQANGLKWPVWYTWPNSTAAFYDKNATSQKTNAIKGSVSVIDHNKRT